MLTKKKNVLLPLDLITSFVKVIYREGSAFQYLYAKINLLIFIVNDIKKLTDDNEAITWAFFKKRSKTKITNLKQIIANYLKNYIRRGFEYL